MAQKQNDKIAQKALANEEVFTLLARDSAAAPTIVEWIKQSLTTQSADKLHGALDVAIKMATEQEKVKAEVLRKKNEDRNIYGGNGKIKVVESF